MRIGYILVAVAVAFVVGFAIASLTSGDGESDQAAVTRSEGATGETGPSGDDRSARSSDEGADSGSGDDQGSERAPESANDPRPEAPDDVIGDRPGGGGNEDDGE